MRVLKLGFVIHAFEITRQLLDDILFMCEMRTKSTYFTRGGKMPFKDLILFTINFVRKSLQIELDDFFRQIKDVDDRVTKQAFSEARQKLSPAAFIKMSDAVLTWFYGTDAFKRFRGFRLIAIDGSVIELHNTPRMREAFGYVENQHGKFARASVSGVYDVENEMMIAAQIERYGTSERVVAVNLLKRLKSFGFKNDLVLMDRGYPSRAIIELLEEYGLHYVMRVPRNFLAAINRAQGLDQTVEIKIDKKAVKIRVLRFRLDSGEEEILITNLLDDVYGWKDFKTIYAKRWGIETQYDELKNKLQFEDFTGDTPIAVEQDFYASIYLSNMVGFAKLDANQKVAEKHAGKELKHEYKVNTNVLIGSLKNFLVQALLEDDPKKRKRMVDSVLFQISRNIIPIRPGRSFPRFPRRSLNKFHQNQKRCL